MDFVLSITLQGDPRCGSNSASGATASIDRDPWYNSASSPFYSGWNSLFNAAITEYGSRFKGIRWELRISSASLQGRRPLGRLRRRERRERLPGRGGQLPDVMRNVSEQYCPDPCKGRLSGPGKGTARNQLASGQGSHDYFFVVQQGRRDIENVTHQYYHVEDRIAARTERIQAILEHALDPDQGEDPWQSSVAFWCKWREADKNDPDLQGEFITLQEQQDYMDEVADKKPETPGTRNFTIKCNLGSDFNNLIFLREMYDAPSTSIPTTNPGNNYKQFGGVLDRGGVKLYRFFT